MGSGKKQKDSKKDVSGGMKSIGLWDAPPEVPVQNIRRMLTSLEKELELLSGANKIKMKNDSATIQTTTNPTDTALIPKTSQQAQPVKMTAKISEKVVPSVPRVGVERKEIALRTNFSTVRQTASSLPAGISLQKAPSMTRHSISSFDRYKSYKAKVLQAYQNRKVFTVYGNYNELRTALLNRGWIEKLPPGTHKSLEQLSQHNLLLNATNKNEYEIVLLSKMLESYPAYFIWQPKSMYHYYSYAMPYRNRIRLRTDLDFTSKEGLLTCVNQAQERGILGAEHIIHPRTFRLSYTTEVNAFDRNYKLTCCRSFLLFISENPNSLDLFSPSGDVDTSCLDFALLRVQKEISAKKGWPTDIVDISAIAPPEWMAFLNESTKVLTKNLKLRCSASDESLYKERVRNCIEDIKKHWPMFKMDGYSNIWIVKPANNCRGYGIVLMTDLNRILHQAKTHFRMRYIAQKYVERPLLIYRTKFDIRQYVLVTIRESITIYLYGDCYVKFSSQEFNLKNLHESVHVTNHSVQSKYKNGLRSAALPVHNMWSLAELKSYFKTVNKENIWDSIIFPRMVNTCTSVIMTSFGSADLVMNSYEMYGLDFMLTEDFEPVLLECNATPDMTHSTCVTARLCPAALRDLVKVVVDLPNNSHANVGNWRPVYKVNWSRGGDNKPVISEYINLLKPTGRTSPEPAKQSQAASSKSSNMSSPRDSKTKKAPVKKEIPKPKTIKPKTTAKQPSLNTKVTKKFVKDIAEKVQSTRKNLSRKEAIGKQVFQAIEALYSMKPMPDFELFKSVQSNVKNGKELCADEKFLKELGDALYSKIRS